MARDYVPGPDDDYDKFFKNVIQYCATKTGGATPAWTHIPQAAMTAIGNVYSAWYTAYAVTFKPHTPQETAEKNRQRDSSEKALRDFVKAYLRYHPAVTDEDRDNMGIPNDDTVRTPVPKPKAQPGADITYPGTHLIELVNIRRVGGEEDDPRSDFGTRIFWGILGEPVEWDKFRLAAPPLKGEDLPHSTFTHRKRYLFDFSGDSGKTVYFSLHYENRVGGERGEGPFGPVYSAIIP
jgi:hypothetical protein